MEMEDVPEEIMELLTSAVDEKLEDVQTRKGLTATQVKVILKVLFRVFNLKFSEGGFPRSRPLRS